MLSYERVGRCSACGKCCDLKKFDHRLFVTTPELIYLATKLNTKTLKPMPAGICPYNENGKCSVYEYRFAGCRTFCCDREINLQSRLTKFALQRLKQICLQFQIPYRYIDLPDALNKFPTL
ncbi:MAG: YkgJ family cysteine cluster protein [Planctomycetota bacterium]